MSVLSDKDIQLIRDRLPSHVACFHSEFPEVLLKAARDAELPVRTARYVPELAEVFHGGQLETASIQVVKGNIKQYFVNDSFGDNRVTLVTLDGDAAFLQIDGRVGLNRMGGAYLPPKIRNASASTLEALVRTYKRLHPDRSAAIAPLETKQSPAASAEQKQGEATYEKVDLSRLSEAQLFSLMKQVRGSLEEKISQRSGVPVAETPAVVHRSQTVVAAKKRQQRSPVEIIQVKLAKLQEDFRKGLLTPKQAESRLERIVTEIEDYQEYVRSIANNRSVTLPPPYRLKTKRSPRKKVKRGNRYTQWFWDFMLW